MADCKIVIVGCNHGIQTEDADAVFGDSEQVTQQKRQFTNLIESLIKENEIQFVAEEWSLANASSAHKLADANKKSWANINTSLEELDEMKIPRDYIHGGAYSPEQKHQWTRQREGVMVKNLREGRGAARKFLVICGFEHVEPLADMLREDCDTVERVDYRKRQWYQAGLFAD
jgi:hypothetical protein